MKISEDILSLTELRANLTERIERLSAGSGQLVVTRNGRPAAVILSPAEYDRLCYESFVRAKVGAALGDVAAGRTVPHDDVLAEVRARLDAVETTD